MSPEHRMELVEEFDRMIDIAEREAYNQALKEVAEAVCTETTLKDWEKALVRQICKNMKLEEEG